jgi:hypothetical protein
LDYLPGSLVLTPEFAQAAAKVQLQVALLAGAELAVRQSAVLVSRAA